MSAVLVSILLAGAPSGVARAGERFDEDYTHDTARPDQLGSGSAIAGGAADKEDGTFRAYAEASSATPVGIAPPYVGNANYGASRAIGAGQLSRYVRLAQGTYTARIVVNLTDLRLSAQVEPPEIPESRTADAYAYLAFSVFTDAGPFLEIRDLDQDADHRQELAITFQVGERGGVFGNDEPRITILLGAVADTHGPAHARTDASGEVESLTVEPGGATTSAGTNGSGHEADTGSFPGSRLPHVRSM